MIGRAHLPIRQEKRSLQAEFDEKDDWDWLPKRGHPQAMGIHQLNAILTQGWWPGKGRVVIIFPCCFQTSQILPQPAP